MTTADFQKKKPLLIFLTYFKKHWGLFLVDILCAVAIAAVDLTFPLLTRSALYDLLPNDLYVAFFHVILILVGAYLLRTFLQFVVTYFGHIFGLRVEADVRADLFRHMQRLGHDFYDKNRTGQLMSRLTSDLFELTELAHHGPEDILTSVLTIVGALIVLSTIQWKLTLVVGLTIPVCLLVVMLLRKKMMKSSVERKQKQGHINTEIESSLSGIRTAKAFANEIQEIRRFDSANAQLQNAGRGFYKSMGLFMCSMEFLLCILNVVVIGLGGWLIMSEGMDYRDLVTFTLYITAFISPMRKLATLSEQFATGYAGLTRFVEVMATEPTLQDKPDAETLTQVVGHIRVDDVSFAYTESLDVLHNVSLDIAPGQTVAVVGPSGGGKTTLCQLIPRFYEVSSGSICIDGKDIRDVTQESLRKNIGIVQQDVFLFADTILENIRYGRLDATDDEVIEAAKKAEIYDDIMAMPNGFATYVGERGTLLSGGQKQRVAIARIFLKNPPILILDEATSALDSVTEAKIQRAFDTLAEGRTTLIIAHRLSTIRNAHRIISIADGLVAEDGTHETLVNAGGIYDMLYATQNRAQ